MTSAKPLILIVEDSKTIRDIISNRFVSEGYDVACAESAEELKTKLTTIKPDTILLDLILPDYSMLQLASKLQMLHLYWPAIGHSCFRR